MRSPWRVPRRSAERRAARDKSRCRAAEELRGHGWCAYRRSASLQGRQIFVARVEQRETRDLDATVPGFRFAQSGLHVFFVRVVVGKARMRRRIARAILFVVQGRQRGSDPATAHSRESGNPVWVPAFARTSGEIGKDNPCPPNIRTACA